ncbi:MAG: lytic transglycosylase domain-containing protein [Actinomycetota bacterium]|nr:lytic transglycosylase domain-containing protein [Actinomycetota bacterium]
MRLRLFALLLVAIGSGLVVGMAENARAGKPRLVVATAPPPLRMELQPNLCPVPSELRRVFRAAARDTDLPLAMIVAVAKVESNLEIGASSDAGAHGLLQVLPSTAEELELDAYHVGENVLAGARYLRQMLDRFESTELALAAYNAGPTAVELKGARPNDETVAYVANVTSQWRRLVGCT